jgi:D-proline reductase (dithiol) PrdB
MPVDSYAFLPRAFRPIYEAAPRHDHAPVWADFETPLREARIGLLSSAGIFLAEGQEPFDVERERREPTWGDPTLRVIPNDVTQSQIDATHLHINTADLLADMNVAMPIDRLAELAADGTIGSASPEHYSVMGYQENGAEVWRTTTGPEIAARCHAADIDALILAPA